MGRGLAPGSGASVEEIFDRAAAATTAAVAVAEAPQVDRLVEEVIRRLDRVSRSERLRRGL